MIINYKDEMALQVYLSQFKPTMKKGDLLNLLKDTYLYFGDKEAKKVKPHNWEDKENISDQYLFQELAKTVPGLTTKIHFKNIIAPYKTSNNHFVFIPHTVSKKYFLLLCDIAKNDKSKSVNYFEKKMGVFLMDALTNLIPSEFDKEVKVAIENVWDKQNLGDKLFTEWYTRKDYPYTRLPSVFDPKEAVLYKIFNELEKLKS